MSLCYDNDKNEHCIWIIIYQKTVFAPHTKAQNMLVGYNHALQLCSCVICQFNLIGCLFSGCSECEIIIIEVVLPSLFS